MFGFRALWAFFPYTIFSLRAQRIALKGHKQKHRVNPWATAGLTLCLFHLIFQPCKGDSVSPLGFGDFNQHKLSQ
jgi:hypothetical protein